MSLQVIGYLANFTRGQAHLNISAQPLLLENVLHVPNVQYYLLSICQLYNDNNYILNFDASFVHIKDKAAGITVLEGASNQVVYTMSPFSHHAFATITEKKEFLVEFSDGNGSIGKCHFTIFPMEFRWICIPQETSGTYGSSDESPAEFPSNSPLKF